MVHAIFLEAYINFALIYRTDNIFPVLTIKYLRNEYGKPTTPLKLATGTKPSILHLRLFFFPCVVQKSNALVGKKSVNMHHQVKKVFHGIFVGIPQNQKGYLVYVPHKHETVSSYDVVFDDIFSSALA